MDKLLKCCPICGGRLLYDAFYQISHVYPIGKSGKVCYSKMKKSEERALDENIIYCENGDFCTDSNGEIEEPQSLKGNIVYIENDKLYITH